MRGGPDRYFRSKDELIEAIIDRVLGRAAARFGTFLDEEPDPEPARAVATAVELVGTIAGSGPVDVTRVAVQAWAEALRNPAVGEVARTAYGTMRGYFVEVARRAQRSGRMSADADPEMLGAALFSLLLGFLLQRLLLGDVPPDAYTAAVGVLLPSS